MWLWMKFQQTLKDPDGKWVAAYYGVMAIGANDTIVEDRANFLRRTS